MSPAETGLESATIDHVALSVGDLQAMTAFYERLGFQTESRAVLADDTRTVLLRTAGGAGIELTKLESSTATPPARDPIEAAGHRGLFHFAVGVRDLNDTMSILRAAGARLISRPAPNTRGDRWFAYVADPEGNLIEVLAVSWPDARAH